VRELWLHMHRRGLGYRVRRLAVTIIFTTLVSILLTTPIAYLSSIY
jgi:hypothetical protein